MTNIVPITHVPLRKIAPPSAAEYADALRENTMLTSSKISPCKRCKWPRVAECACNYCGSVRP